MWSQQNIQLRLLIAQLLLMSCQWYLNAAVDLSSSRSLQFLVCHQLQSSHRPKPQLCLRVEKWEFRHCLGKVALSTATLLPYCCWHQGWAATDWVLLRASCSFHSSLSRDLKAEASVGHCSLRGNWGKHCLHKVSSLYGMGRKVVVVCRCGGYSCIWNQKRKGWGVPGGGMCAPH